MRGSRVLPLLAAALAACGGGTDESPVDARADARVDAPAEPIDAPVADAPVADAQPDGIPSDALFPCTVAGDAGPGGDNTGFTVPTEVTHAYELQDGLWADLGVADFSCLGDPDDDVPTALDVDLAGTVVDFQTDNPVDDATVDVFAGGDILASPDDTVTGDLSGAYAGLSVPAGTTRPAIRVAASGTLDTVTVNIPLAPDKAAQDLDLESVSELTANALPAFIGETRTPGLGLVVFEITDCAGRSVAHAIATVSTMPGCPLHASGAQSYYFSAGSTSLPVRHSQQADTNDDGLFMVMELPPVDTAYVQVWGFVDGQDPASDTLTQLAELPVAIVGDTFVVGDLEPLAAP